MIFGLSTLGLVHTALSLLALVSTHRCRGCRLQKARRADRALSASALATTVTGSLSKLRDSQAIGVMALLVLLVAILARYIFGLAGLLACDSRRRRCAGVWSMVFFTIGEAFLRLPVLKALAPTLTELPFGLAQAAALALFVALAVAAAKAFHPEARAR